MYYKSRTTERRNVYATLRRKYLYSKKKSNLTQAQLSNVTGVPLSTIKRYEGGRVQRPSADTVDLLAKWFHYTSRQLLEHDFSTGDPEPEDLAPEAGNDLRFFEGETYKLYYISEKDNSVMKNGELTFDKHFDKKSQSSWKTRASSQIRLQSESSGQNNSVVWNRKESETTNHHCASLPGLWGRKKL